MRAWVTFHSCTVCGYNGGALGDNYRVIFHLSSKIYETVTVTKVTRACIANNKTTDCAVTEADIKYSLDKTT